MNRGVHMEFSVENENCVLQGTVEGCGPVLLLIHGVACDRTHFREAARYLSPYYSVVTYDRRGYSDSKTGENASFRARVQAEDAVRILDYLGCGSAAVAASSAGGIVALEMAQRFPERVSRLFLHEIPLAADAAVQEELDRWHREMAKAAANRNIAKAMSLLVRAMGGYARDAQPVAPDQQVRNLENLKIFLYHEMDEFLAYGRGRKVYLPMPCVIASGEMDRSGLFSLHAPETAQSLGCRYLRVPGYHNYASDLPYSYAVTLLGVLRSMN